MLLKYNEGTVVPDSKGSPLPHCHILEQNYMVEGRCCVAALIPEEWRMELYESQFYVGPSADLPDRLKEKLPYNLDSTRRTNRSKMFCRTCASS